MRGIMVYMAKLLLPVSGFRVCRANSSRTSHDLTQAVQLQQCDSAPPGVQENLSFSTSAQTSIDSGLNDTSLPSVACSGKKQWSDLTPVTPALKDSTTR